MHKLGVIVPYRDRPLQLLTFKESINNYLNDSNITFELIVVDEVRTNTDFNRGKLLNIGFNKAVELGCDYVVFHDVDMLPIQADYSYSDKPIHLIDKLELPPGISRTLNYDYFGGVTIFPCDLFSQINGYSNEYDGWGFEDDDLLLRCKENHIDLQDEEFTQQGRTDTGVLLDGKSSYIAVANPIKNKKAFTLFCTFKINSIKPSPYAPSDNFSIISFPGFDTALNYTSFHNFNMTFWNKFEKTVSLKSKKYPEGDYIAAIRVSQFDDTATDISFFINGKLIDKNSYAKDLSKYKNSKYLVIGAGNPDRKENPNFFNGVVNNFALYDTTLTDIEISRISRDKTFSLFNRPKSNNLKIYYDFKYSRDNKVLDLSGNGNDGYGENLEKVNTYAPLPLLVPRPYRRKGLFKVLPHQENGYKDGYWVSWSGRKNQVRYLEKFRNYKTNYQKDGLSNLRHKVYNEFYDSKYKCTTIQVEV